MPRDNLTLKIVIYNNGDHCTVVTRVWHIIPCKYEYGILYRGNDGYGILYRGNAGMAYYTVVMAGLACHTVVMIGMAHRGLTGTGIPYFSG